MPFSDFQYPDVVTRFGLREGSANLFPNVPAVAPSPALAESTAGNITLANLINTEKARSELLVAPLLSELWRRHPTEINLFSGVEFVAEPDEQLTGYVDFLVGRGPQLPRVSAPVLVAFEAKRDNIASGYGQCIAAMIGARRFNQRAGTPTHTVFGVVTTGINWKFLRLEPDVLTFDQTEYTIHQLDRLFGILSFITGVLTPAVAA